MMVEGTPGVTKYISQDEALGGRPPVRDRLKHELNAIQKRAAEIVEAMDLLERNPDIERLMNLIRS